jgi:hypothetical protein
MTTVHPRGPAGIRCHEGTSHIVYDPNANCEHDCVIGYSHDPECPTHGDPTLACVLTDAQTHLIATGKAHLA